jgi:hypothetical protein
VAQLPAQAIEAAAEADVDFADDQLFARVPLPCFGTPAIRRGVDDEAGRFDVAILGARSRIRYRRVAIDAIAISRAG